MALDRPDALLIPSFSMPFIHPRNTVVTIHDLAWLLFPGTETKKQRQSLAATHWFARLSASRLIAVSETTKKDLIERFCVQEDQVRVVHHGFSHARQNMGIVHNAPMSDSRRVPLLDLPTPFIVCLGTLQPRKNISRLIDAFKLLKRRSDLPHSLVIAGRQGWMCEELLDKIEATQDVVYLDYVEDRFSLLRKADLLVQPSLYEGFGLSVLDAFSQRVPVACSSVSSLPEVAGDAAEYFDPRCVESMASAMIAVLKDPTRADELRQRGYDRLSRFTWDDCARNTLAVLEELPGRVKADGYVPVDRPHLVSKTIPPYSE